MKFESLIFDIDGTLWDTRAVAAASYNRVTAEAGYPSLALTAEQLAAQFGKPPAEIADVVFAPVPAPERYRLMDRCVARSLEDFAAEPALEGYPGVAETLTALAENHRLFIVSNSEKGYPELTMKKLGISHLISGHLCNGDTGLGKGQNLLYLMKRYRIESCAYIGDTQGDYLATVEAGIPFIWCAYGFGSPTGYLAKIHRFSDLTALET